MWKYKGKSGKQVGRKKENKMEEKEEVRMQGNQDQEK